MGTLISTNYDIINAIINMLVNVPVQNNVCQIPCLATEAQLLAIAFNDGRTDWNTDDCRTFASQVIGLTIS